MRTFLEEIKKEVKLKKRVIPHLVRTTKLNHFWTYNDSRDCYELFVKNHVLSGPIV